MGPKLKILDLVIKRLEERKSPFLGELYGVLHENTLIILSFTLKYVDEQTESKYQISESNFPTEIDLYGVVNCNQNLPKYDNSLPPDIRTIFQDVVVSDNPILLSYGYLEKTNNVQAFFYKNGAATAAHYDIITEGEIWEQFVLIHLNVPTNFVCFNKVQDKEDFILKFTKRISSGAGMFHIKNSEVYLTSSNAEGMSDSGNVAPLLGSEESVVTPFSLYFNNLSSVNTKRPNIIQVDMFMKSTCIKQNENNLKRALAIQHVSKIFEGVQGCMQLDSLIMFQKNRTEKHLYNALIDSMCRVTKLMKRSFFIHENILPKIYHFYPAQLGHFVTFVYPANIGDDDLSDVRKFIHSKFNLPCDTPLFRRSISFQFHERKPEHHQPLCNVHKDLPPSGVNGEVSLVQGNYLYYHYNHENFNDSGWGCAYRSLQTLFSWYKMQGWTDRKIPSIPEIQTLLVDIKDKPKSFIGSRQWIGSMEISLVLDSLLNVVCRLLNVQVGESINDFAHELANHFKKHGTPVMIGGGVLAHTILGVEINDETDDIRYLVLDPHYTGADQLMQVQNKGSVGWKTADFWKKDSFYNLCLPFRKMGV